MKQKLLLTYFSLGISFCVWEVALMTAVEMSLEPTDLNLSFALEKAIRAKFKI